MNYELAKASVLSYLQGQKPPQDDELVLVEEATRHFDFGWMFFYDSRRHRQTGQLSDALAGNGPIFVNKINGELTELGSYKSADAWEKVLRAQFKK